VSIGESHDRGALPVEHQDLAGVGMSISYNDSIDLRQDSVVNDVADVDRSSPCVLAECTARLVTPNGLCDTLHHTPP
jgi:hypothetical protein